MNQDSLTAALHVCSVVGSFSVDSICTFPCTQSYSSDELGGVTGIGPSPALSDEYSGPIPQQSGSSYAAVGSTKCAPVTLIVGPPVRSDGSSTLGAPIA